MLQNQLLILQEQQKSQDRRPKTWGEKAGGGGESYFGAFVHWTWLFSQLQTEVPMLKEQNEWCLCFFCCKSFPSPQDTVALKAEVSWACVGSGSNKLKPCLILLSNTRPFHFHASVSLLLNLSARADDPSPRHRPDLRLLPGAVLPLQVWCKTSRFTPEFEIYLLQQISPSTTEVCLWMAESWWHFMKYLCCGSR